MKAAVGIVVVGAAIVLGWLYWSNQEAPDTSEPAIEIDTAPIESATEEPVEAVEETVESVAQQVETAVEDAIDQAQDAATEAVEAAIDDAKDAARDAVENALGVTSDTVDATSDVVEDAVETATDAASDVVENVQESVTDDAADSVDVEEATTPLADLLTVDGFDAAALGEVVEGSDLSALNKQIAQGLIKSAGENPELVSSVVDQLKELLGL